MDAVAAKLKELNPGFDGQLLRTVRDGVVVRVELRTNHVTNLAPLAALDHLESLFCCGSGGEGQLVNLGPLASLKLKSLECWDNPLKDLSPLANMPLARLDISGTQVSDLKPLHGMPLAELVLSDTPVSDLSPLTDLKLAELTINGTQVSDLHPLRNAVDASGL